MRALLTTFKITSSWSSQYDDLIDTLGTSSYFTTGTAPNRKFVVNVDLKHVGGTVATASLQRKVC